MKKRIYRILSLICIVLVFLGAFTSCDDNNATKESRKASKDKIFTQDSNSINLGLRFGSSSRYKDVFSEIEAVTSNNLKFKFNYTIFQTYTDAFEGKVLPYNKAVSLLEINDAINTAGNFVRLASEGKLMDITDLLPEYAPKYFAKLTEEELEMVTYNGRIYGIPPHISGLGRYCIKIRKDIADKYKVTEIRSWEEYSRLLAEIHENDPGVIPIDWSNFGHITRRESNAFIDTNGYISIGNNAFMVYKKDDPDMRLIPWEDTDSFKKSVEMISNWDKMGYVSRSYGTNAATYITTLYEFMLLKGQDGLQWNIYPLAPDSPSILYRSAENIIGISAESKNAINVLRFIEWVHASQENYDLFMYGIENKDYILKDGRLKRDSQSHYGDPAFWDIDYMRMESHEAENLMDQIKNISRLEEILPPTYGQDFSEIVNKIEEFPNTRENAFFHLFEWYFDDKIFIEKLGMDFQSYLALRKTDKLREALQEAVDNVK